MEEATNQKRNTEKGTGTVPKKIPTPFKCKACRFDAAIKEVFLENIVQHHNCSIDAIF